MISGGNGTGRAAITGIGVISAAGIHPGPFWQNLLAGRSGTRAIQRFDATDMPSRIAGAVDDFDAASFLHDRRDAVLFDRSSLLAVAAVELARRDAGLAIDAFSEAPVIVGSGFGCIETVQDGMFSFRDKGPRASRAMTIPKGMANAPAFAVSLHLTAHGPHYVISSACASGTVAIGNAARLVASGQATIAVAGGTDAPLLPSILASWCAMRVVSRRNNTPESACRPFSADRDGFVLAEGAALVVLEELSAARARGATIYAEVSGYGESSDASHLTTPAREGEVRAIRNAFRAADVAPSDIGYINAHGTATPLNDRIETAALAEALGNRAHMIPVSATKSLTGHAMGASSAIEVAVTALSIHHQMVHPTANLVAPDPECDLDYVVEGSRFVTIEHALKTSFAFGGANAAIILSRSRS
jgi:3-oxoacyl-[acyl-carrier-protein] synthase II